MRVVLHIGTGKAGSTTIQNSFHQNRGRLLEAGVLVPEANGHRINEDLLEEALSNPSPAPHQAELWSDIVQQVRMSGPDVLFLSNEHLWKRTGRIKVIRDRLSSISNDITILMLMRTPTDFYRSMTQQVLKAHYAFPDPALWQSAYLSRLNAWSAILGKAVKATAFQKSAFPNGDLIQHFLGHLLPGQDLYLSAEERAANVSEKAEVTDFVQAYQATHFFGEPRKFRPDVTRLRTRLNAICQAHGLGNPARLKPAVERAILARLRDELLTLRSDWDIAFEDLDYDDLPCNVPALQPDRYRRFRDICTVDETVQEQMLIHLLRDGAVEPGAPS